MIKKILHYKKFTKYYEIGKVAKNCHWPLEVSDPFYWFIYFLIVRFNIFPAEVIVNYLASHVMLVHNEQRQKEIISIYNQVTQNLPDDQRQQYQLDSTLPDNTCQWKKFILFVLYNLNCRFCVGFLCTDFFVFLVFFLAFSVKRDSSNA